MLIDFLHIFIVFIKYDIHSLSLELPPQMVLYSIIVLLSAPVNYRNYFIGGNDKAFLILKKSLSTYVKVCYFAYVLGYVTTPLFYATLHFCLTPSFLCTYVYIHIVKFPIISIIF